MCLAYIFFFNFFTFRFRFRFRFRFLFRIYRLVQITIFLLFIMPSYIPVAMEASRLRALLHCQCLFAVYVTLLICLTYGFLYFFGGIRLFTFFRLHRSQVLNYAVMLMGIYLGCDWVRRDAWFEQGLFGKWGLGRLCWFLFSYVTFVSWRSMYDRIKNDLTWGLK